MKLLLSLLLVLGASAATAQTALFDDGGTSSLKITQAEFGLNYEQVRTEYTLGYGFEVPRVFKSVTTRKWNDNSEGAEEFTTIEAYVPQAGNKYERAWGADVSGGAFKVINTELGQSTEQGCCDSPNRGQMYDLGTGRYVLTHLRDSLIDVRVPNAVTPDRYLASVEDADAPETLGTRTYIGTIGYFNAEGRRELVRIYAGLGEGWGAEFTELQGTVTEGNELGSYDGLTWIDLFAADGSADPVQAFKGFGIKGEILYEENQEKFEIKIKDDKIDQRHSTFSSDLRAVFVAP